MGGPSLPAGRQNLGDVHRAPGRIIQLFMCKNVEKFMVSIEGKTVSGHQVASTADDHLPRYFICHIMANMHPHSGRPPYKQYVVKRDMSRTRWQNLHAEPEKFIRIVVAEVSD